MMDMNDIVDNDFDKYVKKMITEKKREIKNKKGFKWDYFLLWEKLEKKDNVRYVKKM
jgi:hypothetical protein